MTHITPEVELEATAGDGQLIADLARASLTPADAPHGIDAVLVGQLPDSWSIQRADLEPYLPAPRRARGTAVLESTESFLEYLAGQGLPIGTPVYLDPKGFRAVAVLNDHDADGPGWQDWRAELRLQVTDEWQAWVDVNRAWLSAADLAEHIEDWRHTISDPPTADLLDMVRSFRATQKVHFRQEIVEKSGDRALEYATETTATAGATGKLEIPDGFALVLAPFDGAEARQLNARFRYRIDGGAARFGVVLEQPHVVAKAAFDAEVDAIRSTGGYRLMVGRPA